MADDTTTTAPPATDPVDPTASTDTTPDAPATDALGDAGKKALDAERREKRAAEKRATELETRLKEFEDRDKTEAQKLADRAEAAEKRAAELESRSLRLEVASEKGLTAGQAKRLIGSTREELEADADEILKDFAPATQKVVVPDLDLGPRATGSPEPTTPRERINAGLAQHMK
jgi:hypothetical protein